MAKSPTVILPAILIALVLLSSGTMAQQPTQSTPSETCSVPMFKGKDVDTKLKILAKPKPAFSRAERRRYAGETIVLSAIFCGSGQVLEIKVKQGVSDSLNEKAIAAARNIKFTPAENDGKKVSKLLILNYFVEQD
jgi:hypothetical protein